MANDEEGTKTMRDLGWNMAWLRKKVRRGSVQPGTTKEGSALRAGFCVIREGGRQYFLTGQPVVEERGACDGSDGRQQISKKPDRGKMPASHPGIFENRVFLQTCLAQKNVNTSATIY